MKRENLASAVNDGTRRITVRGKAAIVPLKFDRHGDLASSSTRLFKRLSLDDLRFLKIWREQGWDVRKAAEVSGLSEERAAKLVKRLSCFREEDARVQALCEIPTPQWISAKHVENIYAGGQLTDS